MRFERHYNQSLLFDWRSGVAIGASASQSIDMRLILVSGRTETSKEDNYTLLLFCVTLTTKELVERKSSKYACFVPGLGA